MAAFRERFRALNLPLQWVLGILGVFVILFIAGQLFTGIFLDDMLGRYLKDNVRKSSDNVYRLEYDDLDLGFLSGSMELENVHLRPDSVFGNHKNDSQKRPPVLGGVKIKALEINGISLWAYLFRNTLSISSVLIDKPVVHVDSIRNVGSKDSRNFPSVDSSLYDVISEQVSALHLDAFEIRNGSFSLREQDSDEGYTSAEELNLTLRDIRIDSASARSGRLFITDNIELDVTGYTRNLSRGFYTIKLDRFELSSSGRHLLTDSLQLIPRLPRYDFSAKRGMETDRIDLLTGNIMVREVDFPRVIESGRFYAKALSIDSTSLDVFHDMHQPFPPGRAPELPQLLLRKLPYTIKIDTIQVGNTNIEYTEHKEGAPQPGTVSFENIQATMTGLSNYREDLKSNHPVTMEAQTEVMGKGLLNTCFTFYLHDPRGTHTITGNLGPMQLPDFNPALENLAFARIDEGIIHSMEFSMSLDKEKADGFVTLDYENLSIKLLHRKTLEHNVGQKVKSFFVNTFAIKSSNNDPPLRKGEIKFDRDKEKFIFNFWWKALSAGLENSIGL